MDLIVDFPQNRASSLRKRAVSHQEQVDMRFVENLSHKHRDDIWFSSDEMHFFKHQAARTVRAITSTMTMAEHAERHVEDTSAFMGLECYSTKDALLGIKHRVKKQSEWQSYQSNAASIALESTTPMHWQESPRMCQTYQQSEHKSSV